MNVPVKVTPLWIVAAFVSVTEAGLGYSVTKVTGPMQTILTAFFIIFTLLVSTAFFVTLWFRPWVFHGPGDFKNPTVTEFVGALSQATLPRANLTVPLERFPAGEGAQFRLIGGLLGALEQQFVILMHLAPCDLSIQEADGEKIKYEVEYDLENQATGELDGWMFYLALKYTGLVEELDKEKKVLLTKSGHKFALWLIESGRKAIYFKAKYGEWGKPATQIDSGH